MPADLGPIYRFGDFELDPLTRVLERNGSPVSLNRRAFDLLLYLVQNPGRPVTKEQLLQKIWPDSFVDENSVAKSMSVLRKALDEDPSSSNLVVTLPGVGYQFAGTVEIGGRARRVQDAAQGVAASALVQQRITRTVVQEESVVESRGAHRGWLLVGAAAVMVVAGAGGWLVWKHQHPAPQSASVVLADFENATGDKQFDSTLGQAFQIDLEQSPFLHVLPRAAVQETLTQMRHTPEEALTPQLAQEVCERNNAQVVMNGAISQIGARYLLMVHGASCVSGKAVAGYKREVSSKEEVLQALDVVAGEVRKQLGESTASLERFQTPIAQATTSSLQALQAYTQALEASDKGEADAEQTLFERAIALDPNFASAYEGLSVGYYSRQDRVQAAQAIQKAYDLRAHTTEREKFTIEIAYDTYGSFDWEAAVTAMQLFNETYPSNAMNWYSLCRMYTQLGETQNAVEAGEYAYRLAPQSGTGAEILARAYETANRFADAKRIAEAAIADGKDRWGSHRILFEIAYLEHDAGRMKAEADWGLTHQELGQTLTDLGFVAADEGKLREAVEDFHRSHDEAVKSGDNDFADAALMYLAGIQIEYGDPDGAWASLKQMQADSIEPGTTAYFKGELGDLAAPQRLLNEFSSSGTRNTLHIYFDQPELREMIALAAHKPEEAVRDLEPARKYQMRDYGVPYQRARAEVAAGMLDQAVADDRLILASPGIQPIWPAYVLTHLRLAQVLALQGKRDAALAEYQVFLNLWKDGDPQMPLLQEAKSEYAKLQAPNIQISPGPKPSH
jgi:DNA-binding winged helix-turn-helix (wHTH) protein/predicted negative regulator of RcsB-dependent stress response/Flp pilus assembly protein TadD